MSGEEDFGPLVDVLVACVGAVDVISVVGLLYSLANNNNNSNDSNMPMDINNNDVKVMKVTASDDNLSRSKDSKVPLLVVDTVDDDVIDSLVTKVNELTEKVTELVIRSRENSMERFLDAERERYRRSRSPTPNDSNSSTFLEQRESDDENDDSEYECRPSRSISRDDEFRKTIKRSSQVSSQHESREEELARLTELEAEEMNNMDDYVPLKYQSDELDIETIEEMPTCPTHDKIEEIIASGCNEKAFEKPVGNDRPQDINENFIKMERVALQSQSSTARALVKQGNVGSEDFPDETLNEIKPKPHENIMTELKLVENQLTQAKVEESVRIENFPKTLEITSMTNDVTNELKSTCDDTHVVNSSITVEELAKVNVEPSKMVRNFAEVLSSNDVIDESVTELEIEDHLPIVEVIDEPESVIGSLMEVNISPASNFDQHAPSISSYSNPNLNVSMSSLQSKSENISLASSAFDNDYAVKRRTPEPDVSISISQHDSHVDKSREKSIEAELFNINSPTSSGEGLKRSKRCINSLDRSASRSSSRQSHSRKSKSPSVASQEDYKEWFDKFDNHISSELTIPDYEDEEDEIFDSDVEEELLMDADDGNLDGTEICNIDDEENKKGNGDVSVIVTLNLKQKPAKEQEPCNPCKEYQQDKKIYKTKGEELEEMQHLWESKKRRTSILPSTEEQQKNYISMLHPEEFPPKAFDYDKKKQPHEHHEHLHNVGYNEWMKKIVDHHSCHLALSDSDSDSDVPLDEVRMLPLFCDEKLKKRRKKK